MAIAIREKAGPASRRHNGKRKSAPAGAPQNHAEFLLRWRGGARRAFLAALFLARSMVSDHLVFNLVIGGLRNDLLGYEIALGVVWTAIDYLLAVSIANSGKGGEVFLAGGIDIDQISFLGFGCCFFCSSCVFAR